jgi:hypothetical protein
MRSVSLCLAVATAAALLAGCADDIPVRRDNGSSALRAKGEIPPEYLLFNKFDPQVNALLAQQYCATPHRVVGTKAMPAEPGEIIASRFECDPYGGQFFGQTVPIFAFVP